MGSDCGIDMLEEVIIHYDKCKSSSFKSDVNKQNRDGSMCTVRKEWNASKSTFSRTYGASREKWIQSYQMSL